MSTATINNCIAVHGAKKKTREWLADDVLVRRVSIQWRHDLPNPNAFRAVGMTVHDDSTPFSALILGDTFQPEGQHGLDKAIWTRART